jgi:hypothetical protein
MVQTLGQKLALIGLLMLGGCSHVTLSCPPDRIVTSTINGPDYIGAITTLAGEVAALSAGGALMAKAPAAAPSPTSNGTMTIDTLAWGVQSYSCGSVAPVAVPPPAALKAPVPDDPPAAYHPSALPLAIIHG